jgi:hypothetical protein
VGNGNDANAQTVFRKHACFYELRGKSRQSFGQQRVVVEYGPKLPRQRLQTPKADPQRATDEEAILQEIVDSIPVHYY